MKPSIVTKCWWFFAKLVVSVFLHLSRTEWGGFHDYHTCENDITLEFLNAICYLINLWSIFLQKRMVKVGIPYPCGTRKVKIEKDAWRNSISSWHCWDWNFPLFDIKNVQSNSPKGKGRNDLFTYFGSQIPAHPALRSSGLDINAIFLMLYLMAAKLVLTIQPAQRFLIKAVTASAVGFFTINFLLPLKHE